MRISVISNLFPPHVIGGYELGCLSLARAAQAAGHEIRVLTAAPIGRLAKRERVQDLTVKEIFEPVYSYEPLLSGMPQKCEAAGWTGIIPGNVLALKQDLEAWCPDAIWIFNPLGLGPVGLAETAVASRIPTTIHLMDHLEQSIATPNATYNLLPRWMRAKSKIGAISCSQKTLDSNQICGDFSESVVIANGVTMESGCETPRDIDDVHNLVYFGQIESHKGLLPLVKSMHQVRRQLPDENVKLHLVGTGSDEFREKLTETVAELDLTETVIQHGFKEPELLPGFLSDMHTAVFPLSSEEPFAYVVIEAIRAGLCTIVSRDAGCSEFLPQDYPFLIDDRNDVRELSQILRNVVTERKLAVDWLPKLQQAVAEHCDLDRVCIPRCIQFLGERHFLGSSHRGGAYDGPSGNCVGSAEFDDAVGSILGSWYSLNHLPLLIDQENTVARRRSVGRRVERWLRKRIPSSLRHPFGRPKKSVA